MTPPVTTEALADQIEAKMKAMSLLGGDALRAATHDLGALAYIHSTQIVRALRSEAAHQQVAAERDEARAKQRDMHRRAQKAEGFRQRHRGEVRWLFTSLRKTRAEHRAALAPNTTGGTYRA